MADRDYVGRGKVVGKFGNVKISVCLDDIPTSEINEFKGKKYVNLIVSEMRSADKYGKTHTVYVDDWKPDPSRARAPQSSEMASGGGLEHEFDTPTDDQINPEDIPF